MIPKPGPNPPNHPENRLFDPNFTFGVPKSHKNPGVGGSHILENFSQKKDFFIASLTSDPWMHNNPGWRRRGWKWGLGARCRAVKHNKTRVNLTQKHNETRVNTLKQTAIPANASNRHARWFVLRQSWTKYCCTLIFWVTIPICLKIFVNNVFVFPNQLDC